MVKTLQIKNRRDPFINQRLKLATLSSLVYIVLYLLLWKSIPVWRMAHPVFNAREIGFILDFILVIGAMGYIFIFFSLSFLWSRKKFTLILNRIDRICAEEAKTGKWIELKFRKRDRFKFFENTFNTVVSEAVNQNQRRIQALKNMESELRKLGEKVNVDDTDRLLNDLNGPPWTMSSSDSST